MKNSIRKGAMIWFCIIALAFALPVAIAPTTPSPQPTVEANFSEQVIVRAVNLTDFKTGLIIPTTATAAGGGNVIFGTTTLWSLLTRPNTLLDDATYRLYLTASDLANNTGSWTYDFDVLVPGQVITMVEPSIGGGTISLVTNFSISSEFPSDCRFAQGTTRILTQAGFNGMTPFPQVDAARAFHQQPDILAFLNRQNIAVNTKIPLVVTCDDGTRLSSQTFAITYTGNTAPCLQTPTSSCPPPPPPPPGMQQIALTWPPNGVTTTTTTNLTITTDRNSVCRYRFNSPAIADQTGFNAMTRFDNTGTRTTHSLNNLYTSLGGAPNPGESISIAITCDDGQTLSPTRFTITYMPPGNPNYWQNITLITPANGTSNTLYTDFVVRTDLVSECRFQLSNSMIDASGFSSMTSFNKTTSRSTTHRQTNIFSALGVNPVGLQTYKVAVTCESASKYTTTLIDLTYRPDMPPPPDPSVPPPVYLQQIALILPANGITTTELTNLTVRSENSSMCKYQLGNNIVNSRSGFNSMNNFTSITNSGRDHTTSDILGRLQIVNPAPNSTFSVAVTCEDANGVLSPTVFSIMYRPVWIDPNAPTKGPQDIKLLLPVNGRTQDFRTSFSISSQNVSDCRFAASATSITSPSAFAAMRTFPTVTGGLTHTQPDFYTALGITPQGNRTDTIAVTCNDSGYLTPTLFAITFIYPETLRTPPTLSPVVVTNPDDPTAYITVSSNQEIWCSLEGKPMAGAKAYNNYNLTVSGNYTDTTGTQTQKIVEICCENRAGLNTCVNQTINYDYTNPFSITVRSENMTRASSYVLNFTTDKSAMCTARMGTQAITLVPSAQISASSWRSNPVAVNSGTSAFNITCTNSFGDYESVIFNLVVDRTPPVVSDIFTQARTCNLDRLVFDVNASDPTPSSGIAAYQYSLLPPSGAAIVAPTNTTINKYTIRNINLSAGLQYTLRVQAWDGAGNPSNIRDAKVTAVTASDPACDTTPPEIKVWQVPSGTRTNVTLTCTDSQSGCNTNFKYNTVPVNDSRTCVVTENSTSAPFNQTITITVESYLCYLATDKAGNEQRGQTRIILKTGGLMPPGVINETNLTSGTCSDGIKNRDETDIDCGGYACGVLLKLTCTAGKTCKAPNDCASGTCDSGVCTAAACSNGVKDGVETDVDCGGPSCNACAQDKRCVVTNDCVAGSRCIDGFCGVPYEQNEPSPTDDLGFGEEGSSWSIWKFLLIAFGSLLLVGGSGYALMYDPRAGVPKSTPGSFRGTGGNGMAGSGFSSGPSSIGGASGMGGTSSGLRGSPSESGALGGAALTPQQASRERIKEKEDKRRKERASKLKAFDGFGDDGNKEETETPKEAEKLAAAGVLASKSNKDEMSSKNDKEKTKSAIEVEAEQNMKAATDELKSSGALDLDAIEELKAEFGINTSKPLQTASSSETTISEGKKKENKVKGSRKRK